MFIYVCMINNVGSVLGHHYINPMQNLGHEAKQKSGTFLKK